MSALISPRDDDAYRFPPGLLARLPAVAGRLTENAPLGHMTWFGVGGPAEVLFKPENREDLVNFVTRCPKDIPLTMLGVASNLIIRDGGVPGVVIRLGREFAGIEAQETNVVTGAAALDMNVALLAAKHEIAGLEFLSGIPGTIGGALRMNAGAYGGETKAVLMNAVEMEMSYRHNGLPADVIFMGCLLKGVPGDKGEIEGRMDAIKTKRAESQPIRTKTGGSTFANPEGTSAWKVIDAAGCRGFKIGGAEFSTLHCNFMINTGGATAADIERLGEEVRKRVAENSGIMLRWEIKRIGIPLEKDTDIAAFMQKEGH